MKTQSERTTISNEERKVIMDGLGHLGALILNKANQEKIFSLKVFNK
ncbi:MAG: hypothetical protein K0S71_132 [Clostridia bacterium]|jgi:hypothetical protein|nr:hypothetical protein [Clostridia bacterium]